MVDFLDFEKNCHWTGLYRQKSNICVDMVSVRKAISILMRAEPHVASLAGIFDQANSMVRGFGEGIITPILFVAYPQSFGEKKTKTTKTKHNKRLWPAKERGDTKGNTYL